MTIHDLSLKFKGFVQNTDVPLSLLIVGVALVSFALGRFSASETLKNTPNQAQTVGSVQTLKSKENQPRIEESDSKVTPETKDKNTQNEGGYVASKSGTKYHLPWCGSAKQIKEENKIWFKTKEEAERAGYTPASNCKGI